MGQPLRPGPGGRFARRVCLVLLAVMAPASWSAETGRAPSRDCETSILEGAGPIGLLWFREGCRVFLRLWSVAPSAFGQWGRGPTANAESCADCHPGHGRGGLASGPGNAPVPAVLRLSLKGAAQGGAPRPHPRYGHQLQTLGILGRVPAEGRLRVEWIESRGMHDDGEVVLLRRPGIVVADPAFGPLGPDTLFSLRVAPGLEGLGLLEAIPERALRRRLGGRARLNRVIGSHGPVTGRFGWKAGQADLESQVAAALHEDLGVTSIHHPVDNCPAVQTACRAETPARGPEASVSDLESLVAHLRMAAPRTSAATPDGRTASGAGLFAALGCATCHVPSWRLPADTALPGAAGITVRPYTDLALHSMGPGLSDGRPEFRAGPADWRTAPLWGLSRARGPDGTWHLLHDGRAGSVEEAVLWHGGEATAARRRFSALPRAKRQQLLRFVESL